MASVYINKGVGDRNLVLGSVVVMDGFGCTSLALCFFGVALVLRKCSGINLQFFSCEEVVRFASVCLSWCL